MFGMDAWDVVLLLAASYLAVTTLVRLMATRRQELVDEVGQKVAAERKLRKLRSKKKPKDAA